MIQNYTGQETITPWGSWVVLDSATSHQVKRVSIKPNHRLSYQKHFRREENWFIIQGEALVTLNDVDHHLRMGDFIFIPQEAKHRITNNSAKQDLIFIEIQRGSYFGEDDIVRFDDDYGRQ